MIRFLELLISLVIVVVLFVLVGVFLPSGRKVAHSMETNYPIRMVYDTLNSFQRFAEWHPLRLHDPKIQYTLEGPERGPGAKLNFVSQDKRIGSGSIEIIESVENESITWAITNSSYGDNPKRAKMTFEEGPQGKTVDIKWVYEVNYGWDLLGRYAGMYVNRTAGDDMKLGLGNVVGLLTTMPRFDYSDIEVATEEVPLQRMLYVSQTADRNITAVENAMAQSLTDVRKALADNSLQASGPARLITTNFGSEKYEFDVGIPYAVEGEDLVAAREAALAAAAAAAAAPATPVEAAPADAAAPAEGEAPAEPAAPAVPPVLLPVDTLKLAPHIKQGATYQGKVLSTTYQGHPAALPLIRDQLRAFAATHGLTVQDRAYEEYLTDIADTAAEDAQFKIYWPIK